MSLPVRSPPVITFTYTLDGTVSDSFILSNFLLFNSCLLKQHHCQHYPESSNRKRFRSYSAIEWTITTLRSFYRRHRAYKGAAIPSAKPLKPIAHASSYIPYVNFFVFRKQDFLEVLLFISCSTCS